MKTKSLYNSAIILKISKYLKITSMQQYSELVEIMIFPNTNEKQEDMPY